MKRSIVDFSDIPIDEIRMRLKYQKKKYSVTECVKEAFKIANNKIKEDEKRNEIFRYDNKCIGSD
jgi:rRNA-processing protein FCF1